MKAIQRVERQFVKAAPEFTPGDTVKVFVQVVEGDKVRAQIFQGVILGRSGSGLRETFTVRKISNGVAVERIFPLHSPNIMKIERVREGDVRRAKLTYMRDRKGKAARITGRDVTADELAAANAAVTAENSAREEAARAADAAVAASEPAEAPAEA